MINKCFTFFSHTLVTSVTILLCTFSNWFPCFLLIFQVNLTSSEGVDESALSDGNDILQSTMRVTDLDKSFSEIIEMVSEILNHPEIIYCLSFSVWFLHIALINDLQPWKVSWLRRLMTYETSFFAINVLRFAVNATFSENQMLLYHSCYLS